MVRALLNRSQARRQNRLAQALILAAFLAAGAMLLQPEGRLTEGVVQIVDGDTLRLAGEDIRLKDIDAPELQNRRTAVNRLAEMLDVAATPPKSRRATRPSRGARQARLNDKRQAGDKKASRAWRPDE